MRVVTLERVGGAMRACAWTDHDVAAKADALNPGS
jgi:hypothetical protein